MDYRRNLFQCVSVCVCSRASFDGSGHHQRHHPERHDSDGNLLLEKNTKMLRVEIPLLLVPLAPLDVSSIDVACNDAATIDVTVATNDNTTFPPYDKTTVSVVDVT